VVNVLNCPKTFDQVAPILIKLKPTISVWFAFPDGSELLTHEIGIISPFIATSSSLCVENW